MNDYKDFQDRIFEGISEQEETQAKAILKKSQKVPMSDEEFSALSTPGIEGRSMIDKLRDKK